MADVSTIWGNHDIDYERAIRTAPDPVQFSFDVEHRKYILTLEEDQAHRDKIDLLVSLAKDLGVEVKIEKTNP